MLSSLPRVSLERAIPAALALTLLAFALGSASIAQLLGPAQVGRWIVLGALVVLLALSVRAAGVRLPRLGAPGLALMLLLGLAFVSTAWSVQPWLTARRSASLALALAAAFLLAALARSDQRWLRRIAIGLVLGGAAIAVAGGALLVAGADAAVQSASLTAPARFRGLGQNPNTVPLLFAFLAPLSLWLAGTSRGRGRWGWGVVTLMLLATIFASDSRGAVVSSGAGLLMLALVSLEGRRRLLAVGVLIALFAAGVSSRALLDPAMTVPPATASPATTSALVGYVSPLLVNDPNEVGAPPPGESVAPQPRTLLGSSGRMLAWEGALRLALERPVLGYGFGTEDKVFVDRVFFFQGDRPENAYIGFVLQTGILGLTLFLAFGVTLLAAFVRTRGAGVPRDGAVVAFACVVFAGFVMALVQSFVYSVGNIGTITFWIAAFVVAAFSMRGADVRP